MFPWCNKGCDGNNKNGGVIEEGKEIIVIDGYFLPKWCMEMG